MRKLVESTFITLDGVIENPHHWGGPPYWDDEYMNYARGLLFAADALLQGRVTYEGFAEVWPSREGDDYADRINGLPKHVASRTLTSVDSKAWNATLIEGDLVEEVTKLKQQPGQNILKFGTGELDRTLLANNLVDELHLWMFPVVAGSGGRLLDGLVEPTHLKLVDQTTLGSGIVVLVYGPK
jgi:dihydrofolate reductase